MTTLTTQITSVFTLSSNLWWSVTVSHILVTLKNKRRKQVFGCFWIYFSFHPDAKWSLFIALKWLWLSVKTAALSIVTLKLTNETQSWQIVELKYVLVIRLVTMGYTFHTFLKKKIHQNFLNHNLYFHSICYCNNHQTDNWKLVMINLEMNC